MTIRTAFIFFAAVLLFSAQASYCGTDWDVRTMDGTVTAIDMREPSLTVDGGIKIKFPVSNDTVFMKGTTRIRLLDFGVGDYVKIEYLRKGGESRVPAKVTKVELIYDASER